MACFTELDPKQDLVESMNSLSSELQLVRVQQDMQFELLLKGQTRLHQGMDDVQERLSQLGSPAQQSWTEAFPAQAQDLCTQCVGNGHGTKDEPPTVMLREAVVLGETSRNSDVGNQLDMRTQCVGNGHGTTDEPPTVMLCEAGVLGETSRNSDVGNQLDSSKISEVQNHTELAWFNHHPLNFKTGEDFKPTPFNVTASMENPSWLFRTTAIVVNSQYFDYWSALLIVTNAIMLGVQADLSAGRASSEEEPHFFLVAERVFCVFFTIELMLRVYVLRIKFFSDTGWAWNFFDLMVVTIQWLEQLFWVVSVTIESGSGYGGGAKMQSFSVVRVIRILRLVRIIRLVRVMRFISELRTIIISIFNTLRSLMWTLVLLFVIIYIFAVGITQVVTEELAAEDAAQSDVQRDVFAAPRSDVFAAPQCKENYDLNELFGSIGRSILSLFQVICGGIEWNRVVTPLMDKISPFMAVLFCLYVAFSVFALMNVVTGVFLESALRTQREDQNLVLLQRMKKILKQLELDNAGMISWKQLKAKRNSPEMQHMFKSLDVDPQEAENLFTLIDIAEKGEVSTKDFLSGCIRLQGSASAVDMATFMHEYKRSQKRSLAQWQLLENSQKRWSAQWQLLENSLIKIIRMLPTTKDDIAFKHVYL